MLLLNKYLLKLSGGLWRWILTIVALECLTLTGLVFFTGVLADFLGETENLSAVSSQSTVKALFYAFIAAILILVSELSQGQLRYKCTAKARQKLRKHILDKILSMNPGELDYSNPSSVISRTVDGVESMQPYYSQYLPGLIYCFISPFYLFFKIKEASLSVALILFFTSFLMLPIHNVFRKRIETKKKLYWTSMEDMTSCFLEGLRGLTALKLFERDEDHADKLSHKATDFNDKTMGMMKINFLSFLATDALLYGAVIAATFISAYQLLSGEIVFSTALMILLLSYSYFNSVRQLMNITHTAISGVAAADEVSKIMELDTVLPYNPNTPADTSPYNGIRIDNVSFTYTGRANTINGISAQFSKGKITALVGLSGCGKSTVASLLMKFIDPQRGRITIDGLDYLALTPNQLRHHIIMVPQTVSLFTGTIADNLRIASPAASLPQLEEAISDVNLSNWIASLPHGLDTQIGEEGGTLSGGQRQRIGIARALLSGAQYIIFDEATSSVDVENEEEIWRCIGSLSYDKTIIIISHRLSTIAHAHRIYVMDKGSIVQEGTHDFLMGEDGLYSNLVKEQRALEGHIDLRKDGETQ